MLPVCRREIFIKSRQEGLTNKEIADAMKISKKQLKTSLPKP
jgi:DNA-directed RNA polymerase specialized sigma24 family protein